MSSASEITSNVQTGIHSVGGVVVDSLGECSHCGLDCPDGRFQVQNKIFCCQGCQTVYELLAENGLENFYQLGDSQGFKPLRPEPNEEHSYLDDPSVRRQFVQFSDDTQREFSFACQASIVLHVFGCWRISRGYTWAFSSRR